MTVRTLIQRSLRFHWRAHLGVVLGAAIGSAALIGALIVGDSVRESLRERALQRLGRVTQALSGGDRLFRAGLAEELPANDGSIHTALIALSGTAVRQDGEARANDVQVLGVTSNFWQLAAATAPAISNGAPLILNQALATQLRARPGDELILRLRKPSALSQDAPLTPQSDSAIALRLRVGAIVEDGQLGNFSLRANQVPPRNAFLPHDYLARELGIAGKANLLLTASPDVSVTNAPAVPWQIEDFQLALTTTNGEVALSTDRVFLDEPVARAALAITNNARPVLTYLVNLLRAGTNATPYSMVTAAGAPFTPADLRDDEIVVNQWLADDLQVQAGSEILLTYFLADTGAQLVERTNRFRVRSIVPLAGVHGDRALMPEFPGIAKAETTQDWDAGFPLTHKIRTKDDDYWKQYRGTPKAFISLAAGQAMWANRFGKLTAVRWPVPAGVSAESARADIAKSLRVAIDPSELSLAFRPVREEALRAASQSQDFGGLFIGFSFFLIGAALILMALLFQFGIEQRAAEIGTLLALGFRAKQVRRIFLLEGAALAFVGSVIGVVGGVFYARAMLHGLTTVWRSATNTSALTFHASPVTILIGLISGTLVAVITIWFVLRKQARQPARALLAGEIDLERRLPARREDGSQRAVLEAGAPGRLLRLLRWMKRPSTIAEIALVLALVVAVSSEMNAGAFFGAGALALIAGLAGTSWFLQRMGGRVAPRAPSDDSSSGARGATRPATTVRSSVLSIRGAARRRNRSVATVALLASGVFLIASIGAFRLDAEADAWKRSSGTGGFALIGESTLPIVKDLNTAEGRDALGLNEKVLKDVSFVPFRVREGDDASCLNLNRAQQPRLLGVRPEMLNDRFAFSSLADGANPKTPWAALKRGEYYPANDEPLRTNEIGAIGDAASIQWALAKQIGNTITNLDERGNDLELRLLGGIANSILQGSLIIDEAEFTRRFPGVSGFRMFLIDCPSNALPQVSAELTRALQDYGFEVTPAAQRLAAFNAVQNTYLSTFQVLGGLGLLLGSAGLGIVVLRNVLERRGELALLIAVGFRRGRVQKLVLAEHAALLGLGLIIGVGSALVAILPSLLSPRGELPVVSLSLTLGGVLMFGLISTWLATRVAVRGNLLEGLRNE
jgi:putative ABC transport system permease protein